MCATILTSLSQYKSFMEQQAAALQVTQRLALAAYDGLAREQPTWVTSHDARLAYFAGIANHCNTATVTAIALADCLNSAEWHKRRVVQGGIADLNILLTETDKVLRKNVFLQAWALTESSLRRVRSALAGSIATGSIFNHCAALYKTDLHHPRSTEFLELIHLGHPDSQHEPQRLRILP